MEHPPSNASEALWRRKLNQVETARIQVQPELRIEAQLTAGLAAIPDAPTPSNFTARVLAAIELEEARAARTRHLGWNWRQLWPRFAVAAAVLIFAGVSLERFEIRSHHRALAKDVAMAAVAQPLPSVDALENLDVIQRMSQPAPADGELLAALQ